MRLRPLYLALCVLGLLIPMSAFIPWLLEYGVDPARFTNELFANRVSAFFGLDVIVSAITLLVFVLVAGRRERVPHLWAPFAQWGAAKFTDVRNTDVRVQGDLATAYFVVTFSSANGPTLPIRLCTTWHKVIGQWLLTQSANAVMAQ